MRPFRRAVEAILSHHEPYPGCAADAVGRILLSNKAFQAMWPGGGELSPEDTVAGIASFGARHALVKRKTALGKGVV